MFLGYVATLVAPPPSSIVLEFYLGVKRDVELIDPGDRRGGHLVDKGGATVAVEGLDFSVLLTNLINRITTLIYAPYDQR